MTTTTSPVIRVRAYFIELHPELPLFVTATLVVEDGVEAARALAAQFPKSARVRATTLTRPVGDSYANGSETVGYVSLDASLRADGVNGGANETGLRRYRSFRKTAEKLGLQVEWVAEQRDVSAYVTEADFETAVSR